ncbi:MAG: hypothetical protein Q7R73_03925 [bacterium]|nr:hypothetical protein [bacterium]
MRILAVHGYEVYREGQLGELAQAVCEKILKIQGQYSRIILLGGWHLQEAGPRPTIGEAMSRYLQKHGMSPMKPFLFTQFSAACDKYMPPRDSMEEIDLLPTILDKVDINPRRTPFDAICISYFAPRLRLIYHNRGARLERIIKVTPPKLHLRRMIEQIPAYILTRLDPEGKGSIIEKNRDARTLAIAGFKEKNLPSAWLT